MVDGSQLGDEPAEFAHGERQRIATRDNDVANFGMVADVLNHPLVRCGWGIQPSRSMVTRLRVQNRQYIEQTWVVTINARSDIDG